jgi:hypothetical protein
VTFKLSRPAVVSLGIYRGSTLVRTVWTGRSLGAGTAGWTWDGRGAAGAFVAPGSYTARLVARSTIGSVVTSATVSTDAFRTALSASTVRPGQTLTITITSTESLGAAPRVAFTQPGRSGVTKTATSLGGGRYRVAFAVASGSAGTATIRIAGRDTLGGLNVTSRTVTIR